MRFRRTMVWWYCACATWREHWSEAVVEHTFQLVVTSRGSVFRCLFLERHFRPVPFVHFSCHLFVVVLCCVLSCCVLQYLCLRFEWNQVPLSLDCEVFCLFVLWTNLLFCERNSLLVSRDQGYLELCEDDVKQYPTPPATKSIGFWRFHAFVQLCAKYFFGWFFLAFTLIFISWQSLFSETFSGLPRNQRWLFRALNVLWHFSEIINFIGYEWNRCATVNSLLNVKKQCWKLNWERDHAVFSYTQSHGSGQVAQRDVSFAKSWNARNWIQHKSWNWSVCTTNSQQSLFAFQRINSADLCFCN